MNSPKAQAEAMANNLVYELFPGAYPKDVESIKAKISTALEKLLPENERLKGEVERSKWCAVVADSEKAGRVAAEKEARNLQSQLTATEARLETAKAWLEHSPSCPKFNQSENFIVRPVKQCTCGLSAFLSTLTAEKKEQG